MLTNEEPVVSISYYTILRRRQRTAKWLVLSFIWKFRWRQLCPRGICISITFAFNLALFLDLMTKVTNGLTDHRQTGEVGEIEKWWCEECPPPKRISDQMFILFYFFLFFPFPACLITKIFDLFFSARASGQRSNSNKSCEFWILFCLFIRGDIFENPSWCLVLSVNSTKH